MTFSHLASTGDLLDETESLEVDNANDTRVSAIICVVPFNRIVHSFNSISIWKGKTRLQGRRNFKCYSDNSSKS